LSKVGVSASVDLDVHDTRNDNISIDVDSEVGKVDQIDVDVDVSIDFDQVQSTQVDGLRARMREAVDAVESELDRQEREQIDVNVVEEGCQTRSETFLVIASFGQREIAEKSVEDGKVVRETEQASVEKGGRIEFWKDEDVGCAVNDSVDQFDSSSDQEDIRTNVNSQE
jgi:hypothetical protein